MEEIKRALNLVKPGETAIVIFTKDLEFDFDPKSGIGSSGNWKIYRSRLRKGDKVIIYL